MTSPEVPQGDVVVEKDEEDAEDEAEDALLPLPANDDAIGDTVYSRAWINRTAIKTLEFLNKEKDAKKEKDAENNDDDAADLDEEQQEADISSIETELCALWDMTTEAAVQEFILERNLLDFFEILLDSGIKSVRLKEIALGILANLMHHERICRSISLDMSKSFRCQILSFLSIYAGVPRLTQLLRFLITAIASPDRQSAQVWLTEIAQTSDTFFLEAHYILLNCCNADLLKLTLDLLNRLVNRGSPIEFEVECDEEEDTGENQQQQQPSSLNFGSLWLEALVSDSNDDNDDNDQQQPIYALWFACYAILDSVDASIEQLQSEEAERENEESSGEEESIEDDEAITSSGSAKSFSFLRHFWFIVDGLHSTAVQAGPATLLRLLFSDREVNFLCTLFRHTGKLLLLKRDGRDRLNCALAYGAACRTFSRLASPSVKSLLAAYLPPAETKDRLRVAELVGRLNDRQTTSAWCLDFAGSQADQAAKLERALQQTRILRDNSSSYDLENLEMALADMQSFKDAFLAEEEVVVVVGEVSPSR